MTTSSALEDRHLVWACPEAAGHREFVLSADGAPAGRLRFGDEAGGPSYAEFADRRWILARTPSAVTIRDAASDAIVAEYTAHLGGGGVVSFADGARYQWTRHRLLSTKWCFRCEQQKAAVCVTQEAVRLANGGRVTVCSGATGRPETPVLVLLAWYLRLLEFEQTERGITVYA